MGSNPTRRILVLKLEDASGPKLRQVVEDGVRTVVIPFGSVENHGGHLPLGSDALLADVVGEAVAERLGAVLAPTVRVGFAERHMEGPGTLSVPAGALRETAFHIASSLVSHGFGVIALISTHGGNGGALSDAASELNERYPEVTACAPSGDVGPRPGAHSGRWLTSVMLNVRPDLVDLAAADDGIREELDAATAADGTDNLERFVSSIVEQVHDATKR